jgi:hypothetical protein
MGTDLGDVRVHTGVDAAHAAASIHADAFTMGNHIAFAQDSYRPESLDGRRLLAHELAHVALGHSGIRRQEPGGGPADIGPNAHLLVHTPTDPPMFPFAGIPSRPFGAAPSHTDWADASTWPDLSRTSECPGACHQIAESHRRYGEERLAEARAQERLDRWPEMHRQQHGQDLAEQAQTLPQDISQGEAASMQLRRQLLGAASQTVAGPIGPDLRESWPAAVQATLFLDTLFRQRDASVPGNMVEPLRNTYRTYFASLADALRDTDRANLRLLERFARPGPCPNCHQANLPTTLRGSPYDFDRLFPRAEPFVDAPFFQRQPAAPAAPEPEQPGPRERRLAEAGNLAGRAADRTAWIQVIAEFRWAVRQMDEILAAAVPQTDENRERIEQLEYTKALLGRQREMLRTHPDAVKVQAVFYPKPGSVQDLQQRRGPGGELEDYAAGIPWQFYLVRKASDPDAPFPDDFEWQLHDITAARRDNRTVKTRHHVFGIERSIRMAAVGKDLLFHPDSMWKVDPPDSLFEQLDHKDFFPEGQLYWNYPSFTPNGGIRSGTLQTNASRTFWEWVGLIGMSAAILGSLIFAPFSTPMLLAVGVGTGLSALGGYMRLEEMREHGVATQQDANQFYWNLAMDIMSALTLGVGRVAMAARLAGQVARAASMERVWFAMQRVGMGMDAINVGVVFHDFLEQYRAIEASNMPPQQKREALAQLSITGLISGAIAIIPLATGVRDMRRNSTLHLIPDPDNPGRSLARFDADAVDELQLSGAHPDRHDTELLGSVRGEGANGRHTYGIWSDGRITRCSKTPCPDIAESIIDRSDRLRERMLADSAHGERLRGLDERALQLRRDAASAAASPGDLRAAKEALQQRASALDNEMASLEQEVMAESIGAIRSHLGNAEEFDHLLSRQLPQDMQQELADALARTVASGDYTPERLADMVTVLRHSDVRNLRHLIATRVQINRSTRVSHTRESLWWGRMRNAEEVSLLEAQLRGYGHSRGASRSMRTSTGTAGRTLAETSTPGGEHQITSLIGDPMPRQGLEAVLPARQQVRNSALRKTLDVMVGERLHAIGAGLGAETVTGVAHASSFVNQALQNRGVEDLLRFLHAARPEGIRYIVHVDVRTRMVGGGESQMLERITYRVRAVEELPDGGFRPLREVFEGTITHPQNIRAATRPRGRGDLQGIGIEVETQFGALAEYFGL